MLTSPSENHRQAFRPWTAVRASRADGLNKDPELFFPTFLHFRFFSPLAGEKESFFSPHLFLPLLGLLSARGAQTPKQWALSPPYAHTHRHPAAPTICHSERGRVSCSPNYRRGVAESPGRNLRTIRVHSRLLLSLTVSSFSPWPFRWSFGSTADFLLGYTFNDSPA